MEHDAKVAREFGCAQVFDANINKAGPIAIGLAFGGNNGQVLRVEFAQYIEVRRLKFDWRGRSSDAATFEQGFRFL